MLEMLAVIFSGIALIPIGYFIKERYFDKGHDVNIDFENSFFSIFKCNGHKLDGNLGIGFSNLKLINNSNSPYTPQCLELSYMFQGNKKKTDSYVTITGELPNGKPAVILNNGVDSIVIMNWNNLRTKLGEHPCLTPGGVVGGSAFFILESLPSEIDKVEKMEFILKDYKNKTSKHKITINESWKDGLRKGFRLLNQKFIASEDGSVRFVQ